MKLHIGPTLALALPLLFGFQAAARADSLSVTLQQNLQMVLQGTPDVAFFANILNPSATDTIFLNSPSGTTPSPFLSLDDSPFYTNAPLSLAPGASSGFFEIFDIDLDPSTPVGDYVFTDGFEIQGGADNGTFSAFNDLADLSFEVDVEGPTTPPSTVPEPPTIALLGAGFLLLLGLGLKKAIS